MAERDAAISLLRRGLVTQAEASRLAGRSRQVVQYWVKIEELDLEKAREAFLRKLWKETLTERK